MTLGQNDSIIQLIKDLTYQQQDDTDPSNILIQQFNSPYEENQLGELITVTKWGMIGQWLGESATTFTRSTQAYNLDGSVVAPHVPRLMPGGIGNAVLIEEGTTNLVTNGSFEYWTGTSLNNWLIATNATISKVSGYQTGSAVRFTATTSGNNGTNRLTNNCGMLASTQYTISFMARRVNGTGALGVAIDNTGQYLPFSDTTGNWVKCTLTVTTASNTSSALNFYTNASNDVFDIDNVQVEAKAYSTTYCTGIRSAETLTLPLSGKLTAQQGTIEFLWKPLQPVSTMVSQSTSPKILQIGDYYGNGSLSLWAWTGTLRLLVKGQSSSGWSTSPTIISTSAWYDLTKFHYFAITWSSGNNFCVYMDGLLVSGPITISDPITSWSSAFVSLSDTSSSGGVNALYDDLRISNIQRSASEIAANATSAQPLTVDSNTICKLNFDTDVYNSANAVPSFNWNQGGKYAQSMEVMKCLMLL